MKRPVRIIVFGVLCVLVGGWSALDNLGTLNVALNGADGFDLPASDMGGGTVGQMMTQVVDAMRTALRDPAYRWGLGIESALGAMMAALLVVAGVGLLRDRYWAIPLTRYWGIYALPAAVVTVVLQMFFVAPHTQQNNAMGGTAMLIAQIIGGVFMLVLLCIYPILMLILLNRPVVLNYLRAKAGQPVARPATPSQPNTSARPTTDHTTPPPPAETPSPRPSAPQHPAAADQTWRDDPWNDPSIR